MSQLREKQKKTKDNSFVWKDDEVLLLHKVTLDYKTAKTMENIDWESCQTKYSDILDLFNDQYPSQENASSIGKNYPHKKGELTKSILTSKLKHIRQKFRQAVDSGRSGHGRVVLLYFEQCELVWGGSPATETIPSGVESTDIDGTNTTPESVSTNSFDSEDDSFNADQESVGSPEPTQQASCNSSSKGVNEKRDLLNAKLKEYKGEKLKRKLPVDNQLLNVSQEELKIKKQLLERMDNMDKAHLNHMEKLTNNMEKLTGSISEGFAMLRQMMCQAPGMQPHYMASQQNYMYNMQAPPQRPIDDNSRNSNRGHFSYTQSLFSTDDNNY